MKERPVIVSACLVGIKSRYDGRSALNRTVINRLKKGAFIPVCPEQMGGLPTPRPKSEIGMGNGMGVLEGKASVMDAEGRDVTANFLRGAEAAARVARLSGAKKAILKEGSPSCGVSTVKSKGKKTRGMGVTTARLKKEGIEIEGVD
ncbi:MAG: DUF523 domain-containing protein [Deltaproteobacteria bacterium]|nr:DUF523 domain-containing protein [Deltaproteobacteria bacterium]